jgi:competence protein ComGC
MHHQPKKPFTMSHEALFSLVVISIVALAFILSRLTKNAENISKY